MRVSEQQAFRTLTVGAGLVLGLHAGRWFLWSVTPRIVDLIHGDSRPFPFQMPLTSPAWLLFAGIMIISPDAIGAKVFRNVPERSITVGGREFWLVCIRVLGVFAVGWGTAAALNSLAGLSSIRGAEFAAEKRTLIVCFAAELILTAAGAITIFCPAWLATWASSRPGHETTKNPSGNDVEFFGVVIFFALCLSGFHLARALVQCQRFTDPHRTIYSLGVFVCVGAAIVAWRARYSLRVRVAIPVRPNATRSGEPEHAVRAELSHSPPESDPHHSILPWTRLFALTLFVTTAPKTAKLLASYGPDMFTLTNPVRTWSQYRYLFGQIAVTSGALAVFLLPRLLAWWCRPDGSPTASASVLTAGCRIVGFYILIGVSIELIPWLHSFRSLDELVLVSYFADWPHRLTVTWWLVELAAAYCLLRCPVHDHKLRAKKS